MAWRPPCPCITWHNVWASRWIRRRCPSVHRCKTCSTRSTSVPGRSDVTVSVRYACDGAPGATCTSRGSSSRRHRYAPDPGSARSSATSDAMPRTMMSVASVCHGALATRARCWADATMFGNASPGNSRSWRSRRRAATSGGGAARSALASCSSSAACCSIYPATAAERCPTPAPDRAADRGAAPQADPVGCENRVRGYGEPF